MSAPTEKAESIRLALEALAKRHKQLTPALVVKAASDPKSPLHNEFEWDNTAAAQRYREVQARRLIRSVQVIVYTENIGVSVVKYVRDPHVQSGEQGYVDVESLKEDDIGRREALQYELRRAEALFERSRRIALALGLGEEIDALRAQLTALRDRVAAA